jgi:hypothetical protein
LSRLFFFTKYPDTVEFIPRLGQQHNKSRFWLNIEQMQAVMGRGGMNAEILFFVEYVCVIWMGYKQFLLWRVDGRDIPVNKGMA